MRISELHGDVQLLIIAVARLQKINEGYTEDEVDVVLRGIENENVEDVVDKLTIFVGTVSDWLTYHNVHFHD